MLLSSENHISIHALREEGDPPEASPEADRVISIHALREEGDRPVGIICPSGEGFLSTPSARRATHLTMLLSSENHISIHALREEGDPPEASPEADRVISIHALREEGDCSA